MPCTHRRHRRDSTQHLSRVGVGGVYWIRTTTADGCVHTADTTQLDFAVGKFVQTRRDCRQLVANSAYTADAIQLDSWVASASTVYIGLNWCWRMIDCRCKKLPKGLKDWQAFIDLKQKIDDFSECCPLLEMMANKAMQRRHWDRITNATGYTFDIESENFLLRHVMEAPLLKNKDDIEVLI